MLRRSAPLLVGLLVIYIAVQATQVTGEGITSTDSTPNTCDANPARYHSTQARGEANVVFNKHHWTEKRPYQKYGTGATSRALNCIYSKRLREKIKSYWKQKKDSYKLYQEYRPVTPFQCQQGMYGYYAIPCYIIECESHFNWWAHNDSGASWIYQLLGWGAPAPTNFRNKLKNHQIAYYLYETQGSSPWVCS